MYRVLTDFSDLQDNEHVYRAGDEFPRSDFSVSEERINELMGFNNRRKCPLIELIGGKSEDAEKAAEVTEKSEEKPVEEPAIEAEAPVEKPKRRRKKKAEE